MQQAEEYYALCVKWEDSDAPEIAPLHLGEDEDLGTKLGIAVYASPDGAAQREDLEKYEGDTMIRKVSHQELLDAMQSIFPISVLIDGQKVAGSVFRGMLKDALGLPIENHRIITPQEDHDGGGE